MCQVKINIEILFDFTAENQYPEASFCLGNIVRNDQCSMHTTNKPIIYIYFKLNSTF